MLCHRDLAEHRVLLGPGESPMERIDGAVTDVQSSSHGSALKTARETELYGGVLSAALSREHLFLTAEFLRGDE